MRQTAIRTILSRRDFGEVYCAKGWVRTRRDSKGGFSFLELNDGSCLTGLQVIADAALPNYESEIRQLHPGSSVAVEGRLRESPGSGQAVELLAGSIRVYGFCPPVDYPLQKQRVSFEKLREVAHLRARTNTFGAVTRVRNALSFATHRFFQERGFCLLHSPIITASDCEGAGQMFQVTTLDPETAPRGENGRIDHSQDFFGRRTNLTVSGQLEAETYACAVSKVYTFGPTFRAENSNTPRHLAEFWMVEPEVAFADLEDDATLAEDYIRAVLSDLLTSRQEDLAFFSKRVDDGLLARLQQTVAQPFEHLTYSQAVALLEASGRSFEYPVAWGNDLQTEHERYLTEEACRRPVVVTDFPRSIKPFYMRVNDDGRTVAAMDVLVPQIGELIGGSQREEREEVLRERMRETGIAAEDYWWYVDLRRFGSVPHAGFGLGFERLVQFCTGMKNIRDVIPFPRTPRHADF